MCFQDSKNSGRQWTVCQCIIHNSGNYSCTDRHRFKIYTLVSEIHENVDLVLGIKNMFKLEGVINLLDCWFKFLNRSLPIFHKECVIIKPKEQKLIRVTAPFIDEISGLAKIRILDTSKFKFIYLV